MARGGWSRVSEWLVGLLVIVIVVVVEFRGRVINLHGISPLL